MHQHDESTAMAKIEAVDIVLKRAEALDASLWTETLA
ncbi:hypothetical protein M728_005750 (plasmid) [Ensifer sp. WSM1721]